MKVVLAIAIQVLLMLATLTLLALLNVQPVLNLLIVLVVEIPLGNRIAAALTGVNVIHRLFD